MMRRTRATSPGTDGPGDRVAAQSCCVAPSADTRSASGDPPGQATSTSNPRATWSPTSDTTQLATPSVTGWLTCKTFIATLCPTVRRAARTGCAPGRPWRDLPDGEGDGRRLHHARRQRREHGQLVRPRAETACGQG